MPERANENHQAGGEADRQVERLEAVERIHHADEILRVERRARDGDDAGEAEKHRRHIQQGQERAPHRRADPAARAFGKDQREMQEQRRQQQQRHDVGPVEEPVEAIEPTVERESDGPEEGQAQPEKVQRGFVAVTPVPDTGADEQREDAHHGEHEVEGRRSARQRRQSETDHFGRLQAQHRVAKTGAGRLRMHEGEHFGGLLNGPVADGQQHVAGPHTRLGGRRSRRHLCGGNPLRSGHPEHAVLDLMPRRAQGDVGQAEPEQRRDKGQRHEGSCPTQSTRYRRSQ